MIKHTSVIELNFFFLFIEFLFNGKLIASEIFPKRLAD